MILLAAILFVTVFTWDLLTDYSKWKKGPFDHKDKWVRGLLLLPSTALLAFALPGSIIFGLLYTWAMTGFIYWVSFDISFNRLRGLPWNYTGVPDAWDAKLDKFQRKYPAVWIAKIIVSIGLKVGYIIMVL